MNLKMQRLCFNLLENSAQATGTRWAIFILSAFLWGYSKFVLGGAHYMMVVILAGSLLGLLLSLRDKLALQYLKRHPQAQNYSEIDMSVLAAPLTSKP